MAKVKMFPARKLQPVRNQALPYRELRANAMRAHELQPTRWKRAVISHHIAPRRKETEMNRDIVAGKWQQLRGKVKEEWGKLTDDDLTTTEGKFDKLSGVIRERYGYTREGAEDELERFYKKYVYVDEGARR